MMFDCTGTGQTFDAGQLALVLAREIRKRVRRRRITHGDCVGGKRSPEYISWRNMLKRCHNVNDTAYHSYGGRGIRVCARWRKSYAAFLADMGRKPTPRHTIDRKDVDKGYTPSNCRWATYAEQNANKRNSRYDAASWATHGGKPDAQYLRGRR
jgi:hypothetical protein